MPKYFADAEITTLPWHGSSPDLNPLDYGYWGCLKAHMRRLLPKDLGDIKACMMEARMELDRGEDNKMIDAFPRRLRRCMELGGEEIEAFKKKPRDNADDDILCCDSKDDDAMDVDGKVSGEPAGFMQPPFPATGAKNIQVLEKPKKTKKGQKTKKRPSSQRDQTKRT